jgi:hypothetical protein
MAAVVPAAANTATAIEAPWDKEPICQPTPSAVSQSCQRLLALPFLWLPRQPSAWMEQQLDELLPQNENLMQVRVGAIGERGRTLYSIKL